MFPSVYERKKVHSYVFCLCFRLYADERKKVHYYDYDDDYNDFTQCSFYHFLTFMFVCFRVPVSERKSITMIMMIIMVLLDILFIILLCFSLELLRLSILRVQGIFCSLSWRLFLSLPFVTDYSGRFIAFFALFTSSSFDNLDFLGV